jgi:hypothetical protein
MNNKERKKERRNKPRYREITLESSRPAGLEKNDSKQSGAAAAASQHLYPHPFRRTNIKRRRRRRKLKKTGTREQQSRKLGKGKNRAVGKWFVA